MNFANSGSLTLWLNDVQKQSLTFIDNDTRTITDIRLGAQGIEDGTRGTLYYDDFESRRFSYIGTLPDPGVDDPQATNQPGWFARTYQYSASIPHAVVSVTSEQSAVDSYEYDANGNMTCRIEGGITYTHAYNAENRASSIAKRSGDCATGIILESWSFLYDGDGVRVGTVHFTGASGTPDSTTSYYMGGQFEVKDGATKKYYSIAGMIVAVNDGSALQYLLTDHLGSTVAVTNSSGTLTSQQRYPSTSSGRRLPFGGTRAIPNSPILGTDFGYTGQRLLDSGMGGIMDYKARFYSVGLGRFIQPDSIIPRPANPQSWNRYSYVLNRPINFNDPTGHDSVCGYSYSDPECPQPTPAPLPTSPTDPLPGGNCNGIPDCGLPDTDDTVEITNPGPLDDGLKPEECNINCDLGIAPQQETTGGDPGWVDSMLANEWTPLIADLVQLGAAAGLAFIFIGIGAAAIGPGLALLAIALGALATVAMIANLASLDYQADHGLHGVTRGDFNLAVLSNFAAPVVGGLIPETIALKLGRELPKGVDYFFEILLPAISVLGD